MNGNSGSKETNPKASSFAVLQRIAVTGQILFFRLDSDTTLENQGLILELFEDGVLIENDTSTEWISSSSIHSWRLIKKDSAIPSKPIQSIGSATDGIPTKLESLKPPVASLQNLPTPAEIEFLFTDEPNLSLSSPSFDFPDLDRSVLPNIVRWKNRYDYAQKVREPARMTQDVGNITELAESLRNSSLYVLAGLLAEFSGLGNNRSKNCFESALELDQNHHEATISLAVLSIRNQDWSNAAKFLLWAIQVSNNNDDKPLLVRNLGRCVIRIPHNDIPPLGILFSSKLPEKAYQLAIRLVAFIVRQNPEAYKAALDGDVDTLRKTVIGNDIFPWKDEVTPPIPQRLPLIVSLPQALTPKGGRRGGRISVYYPSRNFGFIVENSTGQTWFFHKTSVVTSSLLSDIIDGKVRQDVTFAGSGETQAGKYPIADEISIISENIDPMEPPTRAPLGQRLLSIPKDGSYFARAMEAEQLDQLDKAENLYREEIIKKGSHSKSAIKNLAALKNRKGKPEAAIEILDTYRHTFNELELISVDRLKIQFFVKARKYPDAAQLLSKLADGTKDKTKRIEYLRQEAYCFLASGDFDIAISKLNHVLKINPHDSASILLLNKAQDAKQTGIIPLEVGSSKNVDEQEDLLSSLALGLSTIARRQIESCELRGLDTRTKESLDFKSRDVKQVQLLLDGLKGRRPRERADYLLTLAWLCEHASNITENRSLHECLRRHFLAVTEAAMSEDAPKDVVRCYAVEALTLSPVTYETGRESATSIEGAWVLLLGSYIENTPDVSTLLQPEPGNRLEHVLSIIWQKPDEWDKFVQDAVFYKLRAPAAFTHLSNLISKLIVKHGKSTLDPLKSINESYERKRIDDLDTAFATIPIDSISADRLRRARDRLVQLMSNIRFETDRTRMHDFIKLLTDAADYSLERHFRERETRFLRLEANILRFIEDLHRFPTHLSIEQMSLRLSFLRDLLKADFMNVESKKPQLELRNVLDNDYYVLSEGNVALRLILASIDESAPPVEAIGLVLEEDGGEPCHSPDPLHGGQTREIELIMKPSEKQINDGAFTIRVNVEYRDRKGLLGRSQPFPIAVRLGKPTFDEIPNPYGRYSGGAPVEDESMFFGRTALVNRIVQYVSIGTMGQCFVLYGQKRSGKSSVLKQVEKRLSASVLFASMSAGTFSTDNLWRSFARLFLQELSFKLEDLDPDYQNQFLDWPSSTVINDHPLESIRKVTHYLSKIGHTVIIAIDEFTYIFESEQKEAESFMRGWKALLEAKAFNAILVGQDTMPRFKQAFPNEFGITHDERITYLDQEEAKSLASQPIELNEKTRYRGQAINRLVDLTAGSPYFLQIVCDQLVRHLNARKAVFITEADIDQVTRTLTFGGTALPPERFDALVTAAGEKVATIPRGDLWHFLGRVARESLHSGWCSRTTLAEIPKSNEILKDLIDREILAVEGDRVSIRVNLFAAWLRANQ